MPENHPDQREAVGYAYNGLKLVAVGYTEEVVEHWENRTEYTVSRTPKAEARS
jgi:hypothetical protein